MEENMSSPDEISSVMNTTAANKKRKFRAELLEMPLLKLLRGDQILKYDASYDFGTERKKFERGGESDVQSSKDSNSFQGDEDYIMCAHLEAKTLDILPNKRPFNEPSISSASWGGSNSDVGLDSTESRSFTKLSSSYAESLSISGSNYDDDLLEFERHAEYSLSEDETDDMNAEKQLFNLLYSNGMAPSNYVLSSGRWSVDQGADNIEEETKKLTIDKEFEQYFSELML